jgi:4a-hydroxytetrahydrobiopterin dehydratase
MSFVVRIAELAEDLGHHPDILIRYNKVTLTVSTHDAGGLTDKDFELARQADLVINGGSPAPTVPPRRKGAKSGR